MASRGDLQAVGIRAARLITTLTGVRAQHSRAEQGGNNLFCTAKYLFKKLIGTISRSAASSPPRYFCYFQLKICSCRSHLREVFASFRNARHLHVGGAAGPGPQRGLQQRGGGGEGVAAGEGAGGGGVVCHQEAGHQHQGREVVVGARLLGVVRLQTWARDIVHKVTRLELGIFCDYLNYLCQLHGDHRTNAGLFSG